MKLKVDIIIPTYNGLSLLKKHLPTVLENSPEVSTIIVVDNGSTDETANYLKQYPRVKIHQNSTNLGFTAAINQGVAVSDANFVVLLNNDVSPHKNYLKSALKFFEDKSVFAVTFSEEHSCWPRVSWHNGKIQYTNGEDREHPRLSLWASGGSSIIRRSYWNKLGGFNEIFSPGYCEDLDLGWRAYRQGYSIIWDPSSKVSHLHESSFGKLNQSFVNFLKQRNELIFLWLNLTDTNLRLNHFKFLVSHSISHPGYLKIILGALRTFKQADKTYSELSDLQILSKVNQIYES